MADFRKFSEKYAFRDRSETPEIAIELSLQPWRRFGVDGVILFSGTTCTIGRIIDDSDLALAYSICTYDTDILTPLPAMGIDFTIVPGQGPKILKPLRSENDVRTLSAIVDTERQVPFLGPTLKVFHVLISIIIAFFNTCNMVILSVYYRH